jgi:sulfatase modifying factor 1
MRMIRVDEQLWTQGLDRQLFCGSGSEGAKDRANFPAFMPYGFRSSLQANYTVHNLGFRCAQNASASDLRSGTNAKEAK